MTALDEAFAAATEIDDIAEEWAERAAIVEYDGKYRRPDAEEHATVRIREKYGAKTTALVMALVCASDND